MFFLQMPVMLCKGHWQRQPIKPDAALSQQQSLTSLRGIEIMFVAVERDRLARCLEIAARGAKSPTPMRNDLASGSGAWRKRHRGKHEPRRGCPEISGETPIPAQPGKQSLVP